MDRVLSALQEVPKDIRWRVMAHLVWRLAGLQGTDETVALIERAAHEVRARRAA